MLARVFSHTALDSYIPGTQRLVRSRVQAWCRQRAPLAVYPAAKALTFCIAIRILLGLRAADHQLDHLSSIFEHLMENIFSLPLDIPFSGLRKVRSRPLCPFALHRHPNHSLQFVPAKLTSTYDMFMHLGCQVLVLFSTSLPSNLAQ